MVKNLPANTGDTGDKGSIPGSGRSPEGGNDNSVQYSCLESPMDRGAWQATILGIAELTQLSTEHSTILSNKHIQALNILRTHTQTPLLRYTLFFTKKSTFLEKVNHSIIDNRICSWKKVIRLEFQYFQYFDFYNIF